MSVAVSVSADLPSKSSRLPSSMAVIGMSASSLRCVPGPDRNGALRARIVAVAQRHRRYGAGMIYLKLRQAGERITHKRVARLYAEARLPVRRRRRKEV